jgi:hypothetical protein
MTGPAVQLAGLAASLSDPRDPLAPLLRLHGVHCRETRATIGPDGVAGSAVNLGTRCDRGGVPERVGASAASTVVYVAPTMSVLTTIDR